MTSREQAAFKGSIDTCTALVKLKSAYYVDFLDIVHLFLQCRSLLLHLPKLLAGSFELACEELIDVC